VSRPWLWVRTIQRYRGWLGWQHVLAPPLPRAGARAAGPWAAALYVEYALVLNVSLNHRFSEVMTAGAPQVVFGDPALMGGHRHLAERPDVFWASTIEELERLRAIPVAP